MFHKWFREEVFKYVNDLEEYKDKLDKICTITGHIVLRSL